VEESFLTLYYVVVPYNPNEKQGLYAITILSTVVNSSMFIFFLPFNSF
jgi:hypothetical protein